MVLSKAFEVQVELGIQSVTCPGVWLCPNGKVSVQLYMLGSCIQTSSVEPLFPLIYNEKFVFHKTFVSTRKLVGLQKVLNKEILYAELIQWQNCDMGNVLASFQTTLTELLFSGKRDGRLAGVNVDLLMEPKSNFPGILSPKIEVCTKTVIEDTICRTDTCNTFVVNSEMLCSKGEKAPFIPQQRTVCHSLKYHRNKQCPVKDLSQRPLFAVRKVDDNLILRKPQELDRSDYCHCGEKACGNKNTYETMCHVRRKSPCTKKDMCATVCDTARSPTRGASRIACVRKAQCECSDNSQENCPVCSKYKYYFDKKSPVIKSRASRKSCCCGSPKRVAPLKNEGCKSDRSGQLMNYPPRNKSPSLAAKIHNRIRDTLDECPRSPCLDRCSVAIDEYDCDCSTQRDMCSVSSFGQFYKNLYRKSKAKCGKYIACD